MKKLINISNDPYFYILLSFLLMINFSIAYCYVSAAFLLLILFLDCIIHKKVPAFPKIFLVFLPYIFFTLLSTIFAFNPANSFKDNKELLIFLLFPIFLAIVNRRKRLKQSLFTILIATFVSSLIGIYITLRDWRIDPDFRLKGLTSHWMTYSGLLMLVFIFFFVYLFYEKKKNLRIMIAALLLVILVTIAFTLTRNIWIGIGASLGIFLIYYRPKITIYLIPIVLILLIVLPDPVKNRFISIFDLESNSNKERIIMYQVGFKIFKASPRHILTGVGPNNVKPVYKNSLMLMTEEQKEFYRKKKDNLPERYKDIPDKEFPDHLHNNFLHILVERGILALLAFLLAFTYLFVFLIKKIRLASPSDKVYLLGTLFSVTGFLIAGLFEYNFGDSEILFLLFFLMSIPFLTYKDKKEARNVESR